MAGNSFGTLFRISTFGESHGGGIGAVLDGCPPGLELNEADIQAELDRRLPGQSEITTPRKEDDSIQILSGLYEGKTTGTPIMMVAYNHNVRSQDYYPFKDVYRPGHADYTYQMKYGLRDFRGSGRASARETIARVATGAVAKKYLRELAGIEFLAWVEQVGDIVAEVDHEKVTLEQVESNIVRCPDPAKAKKMIKLIEEVRDAGDSIGGVIRGVIRHAPVGLGEPVFDKIAADLGKGMLSINAVKGFDIGEGFGAARMRGSQHNDPFELRNGRVRTTSNHAGGTLGGISSGETIYFRVAFKPVSTIKLQQHTVSVAKKEVDFQAQGRHDPCVLPRAVPIVEAMSALVTMDHYLRAKAESPA